MTWPGGALASEPTTEVSENPKIELHLDEQLTPDLRDTIEDALRDIAGPQGMGTGPKPDPVTPLGKLLAQPTDRQTLADAKPDTLEHAVSGYVLAADALVDAMVVHQPGTSVLRETRAKARAARDMLVARHDLRPGDLDNLHRAYGLPPFDSDMRLPAVLDETDQIEG